jgi:hypothetical protein
VVDETRGPGRGWAKVLELGEEYVACEVEGWIVDIGRMLGYGETRDVKIERKDGEEKKELIAMLDVPIVAGML